MILIKIFLKKFKPTTNTLRFKIYFNTKIFFYKKINFLKNKFFKNSNKNIKNNLVLSSRLKKKFCSIVINFNFKVNKNYFVILNILRLKKKSNILSLVKYANGSFSYKNLIHGCFLGDIIKVFSVYLNNIFNIKPGFIIFIKYAPNFSLLSNLSINNSRYPKLSRSAGTYSQLMEKDEELNIFKIKLNSGIFIFFSKYCFVILGRNSNIKNKNFFLGKAGLKRTLGFRPKVRGVAMNAVDHPNGGRTKSNAPEKSIWGWIAKKNK